ncbi:hypothetical protein SUS17_1259 [Sphingomonas sp. S17]|nr:hypothetical protein SUS17_1259 [Sphingomonas sp. S17]
MKTQRFHQGSPSCVLITRVGKPRANRCDEGARRGRGHRTPHRLWHHCGIAGGQRHSEGPKGPIWIRMAQELLLSEAGKTPAPRHRPKAA